MNGQTYSEKLKDPRWQKKRLEVFERDNWTCKICGCKDKTLHVHHKFYFSDYDTNPWDYDGLLLETLCKDCHEEESNNNNIGLLNMWLAIHFSHKEIELLRDSFRFVSDYPNKELANKISKLITKQNGKKKNVIARTNI